MDFEIRPIKPEELTQFVRVLALAFGGDPSDQGIDLLRPNFEFDRSLAAFDQGRMVATAGAVSFLLTLPGATQSPAAGVSFVTVLPTHRRRGILTRFMQRQLSDLRKRGEPLAILYASESEIYGRYGYGSATESLVLEVDTHYGSFERTREITGQTELLDRDAAREVLPGIYDRMRRSRPGAVNRSEAWWDAYVQDAESRRHGESTRRYVAYRSGRGDYDGYVSYGVKNNWEEGVPDNEISLSDLIVTSAEANAALWRYCLSVDLVSRVGYRHCPVDEPVRRMLKDPRRARVKALRDGLWVRLVDISTALEARRYLADGEVCFDLTDPFCPDNSGTYLLEGGPDGAKCARTTSKADLALEASDLAAGYLGGVRFTTLARAGRVCELTSNSLQRADAMFASDPAPWCPTHF